QIASRSAASWRPLPAGISRRSRSNSRKSPATLGRFGSGAVACGSAAESGPLSEATQKTAENASACHANFVRRVIVGLVIRKENEFAQSFASRHSSSPPACRESAACVEVWKKDARSVKLKRGFADSQPQAA